MHEGPVFITDLDVRLLVGLSDRQRVWKSREYCYCGLSDTAKT
jgi:hypothetical protein